MYEGNNEGKQDYQNDTRATRKTHRMRKALIAITVSGRRQRLRQQAKTRPTTSVPKAPPFGVATRVSGELEIERRVNGMSLQELRDQVRREDERIEKHKGGYYSSTPVPLLQHYRERITMLEAQQREEQELLEQALQQEPLVRRQEAEHLAALQARRQQEAERAEKAHQEELDRQAAMTEIPAEQVAQEPQAAVPPFIGEVQGAPPAQVINSSTESSTSTSISRATTRMMRQEEADEQEYWDNIVDIMYAKYNDENDIEVVDQLYEGVLYWMSTEDIKDSADRARSKKDPEAELQFKQYFDHNLKLDQKLREEYEKYKGPIEDREDYQQALEDKDANAIQEMVYEYAKG
eukprot:320885-Amphidinium_carterae.1